MNLKKNRKSARVLAMAVALIFFLTLLPQAGFAAIGDDDEDINPIIMIDKLSAEEAVAGGEFNLVLGLRNISKHPALNIKIEIDLQDSDDLGPFTLKSQDALSINKIEGNSSKTVILPFSVKENAQNKDYTLHINVSGQNASFQNTVHTSASYVIPVTFDVTKPVLIIKDASISPANPDLLEEFSVNLQVWNLSKTTDARNIVLLLDGQDNFEVMEISNKKNLTKLEKGRYETVTYRLKAKETREDNTVKLKMDYDYLGSQTTSVEEIINLPLPSQDVAVGATPWVIINRYTLSAEKVLAGNTVTLSLDIENTNLRPVKNVKISLGVIKIEETNTGTTTTGGTVFSPVNSSNSFYIDSIPGKTVITKSIDLYVDPNATAKTYIVPVTINYEDRQGKTLTSEEMVNIPVTQDCKLQVLSTQIPPMGFVGQPIPVMAEFVNIGKVALGNFMVSLEGNFSKDNGFYYVGNLDIGVSDFFQGSVIPEQEGTLEGMLVFSYIDNNNQTVREEVPFTIEVQGSPETIPGMEGDMLGPDGPGKGMPGFPQEGGLKAKLKSWALPFILLAVIAAEGVYILRMKKKKSEEFFNE